MIQNICLTRRKFLCSKLNYSCLRVRERDRTISLFTAAGQIIRLLTLLHCLLEFSINFQVAVSTDYFNQAPSNSKSLHLFTCELSDLLRTANPPAWSCISKCLVPIQELASIYLLSFCCLWLM